MNTIVSRSLAVILSISLCGCGAKTEETRSQHRTDSNTTSETNAVVPWVSTAVPPPASDGWITLFDGEKLHGSDPTNECFSSSKAFVQNKSLWLDSGGLPLNLKAHEVAFRVQVKKVSGQNFSIYFGRDVAWFNGGQIFGIGRNVNHHYEDLQGGKSAARFDEFFEMEVLVADGKVVLMADGKTVVNAQDKDNSLENGMGIYALKGISVFRRIQVKLSDVETLFPKDATAADPQPKPDATERLKKVKSLYDQGLINKEDYDKKVKEIMDSL